MSSPTAPQSPYGVSKLAGELHARLAGTLFGIPSFGLRLFNVYGPGQPADSPYSGVIALFARHVNDGRALTVHGDGSQCRDFVFVDDVVDALVAAWDLATLDGPVETVATGRRTTVRELAETIMAVADRRVPLVMEPARPGDIAQSYGTADFLHRVLGRSPIGLTDGMALTLPPPLFMPRAGE